LASTITALRGNPSAAAIERVETRNRSIRRRVNVAWGLLFFNSMTYTGGSILPLPTSVGKGLAQAALPLALFVLLTVNPQVKVRPNAFLCIVSLLVMGTVLTAVQTRHLDSVFLTLRFAGYVGALWMLTPWWGRSDMMLLRIHLRWIYVALGLALLGMLISPGKAFAFDGRLEGVLWPMTATQLGQYGAVAVGLTVLLWLGRQLSGRLSLAGVTFAMALLLLTHTRTAVVALVAGMLMAGLSVFAVNARVRKFFAAIVGAVSIAVTTAGGFIATWLYRGENVQGLTSLTGRTNFWALVLEEPRTTFQQIFGFGLSNASIDGNPIDSNWLAAYQMEGYFGAVACGMMLAFLLAAALFQSQGIRRALILFLVMYCTVASFTEDALPDITTYLLHLVVAASLLA
jgi:hypothetical protein